YQSGRESQRESNTGSGSPRLGRSNIHSSSVSSVSSSPSGVVLLSQRPLDPSLPTHKVGPGVDGSSGDLSSGPASLGSGDEGSGASLGSQSSLSLSHPPTERSKRSHMWQTTPVVDWSKEQVNQWLIVQGLEGCVGRFQEIGITGPRLLNLDVRDLKALGLAPDDKSRLKRKVKELRIAVEKERKQVEKEKKEREKLQKKAEKLAEKAEKKKK
ncbi:sterile alpha motif domain-containing protein 14-like, partial [Penaeus chinensis]|uniref:sterile alpha motif domain-containing protein 14-like n=1 Tax=Penaeus chinensis TaxID=139456 RepID=UPI001FB7F0B6